MKINYTNIQKEIDSYYRSNPGREKKAVIVSKLSNKIDFKYSLLDHLIDLFRWIIGKKSQKQEVIGTRLNERKVSKVNQIAFSYHSSDESLIQNNPELDPKLIRDIIRNSEKYHAIIKRCKDINSTWKEIKFLYQQNA